MKHLLSSFGGTVVIQLCNIATGILAARLLLPEGRGEMAAILLWPSLIAALAFFSLDQGVMYHSARQPDKTPAYLSAGLSLAAPLGAIAIVVGMVVVPLAYAAYGEAVTAISLVYLIILVPTMFVGTNLTAVLTGRQRFNEWNVLRVAQPVVYLGLIAALAAAGRANVTGFVFAGLAAGAIMLPVAIGFVVRGLQVRPVRPRRSELRDVAAYSLSVHVSAVLGLLSARLDQMAIALLLTPAELGLYAVALALGGAPGLLNATIFSLAYPKIAAQSSIAGKAIVLGRYLRLSLALGLCGSLAVAVLAPFLLELLFGEAYVPAAAVAAIIAFTASARGCRELLAIGFKAIGAPRYAAYLAALSLVVSSVSLIALIPLFGLVGAAAAHLLAVIVAGLAGLAIALRIFDTSLAQLLKPSWSECQFALDQIRALLNDWIPRRG